MATIKKKVGGRGKSTMPKRKMIRPTAPPAGTPMVGGPSSGGPIVGSPVAPPMAKKGAKVKKCCGGGKVKKKK